MLQAKYIFAWTAIQIFDMTGKYKRKLQNWLKRDN